MHSEEFCHRFPGLADSNLFVADEYSGNTLLHQVKDCIVAFNDFFNCLRLLQLESRQQALENLHQLWSSVDDGNNIDIPFVFRLVIRNCSESGDTLDTINKKDR